MQRNDCEKCASDLHGHAYLGFPFSIPEHSRLYTSHHLLIHKLHFFALRAASRSLARSAFEVLDSTLFVSNACTVGPILR